MYDKESSSGKKWELTVNNGSVDEALREYEEPAPRRDGVGTKRKAT